MPHSWGEMNSNFYPISSVFRTDELLLNFNFPRGTTYLADRRWVMALTERNWKMHYSSATYVQVVSTRSIWTVCFLLFYNKHTNAHFTQQTGAIQLNTCQGAYLFSSRWIEAKLRPVFPNVYQHVWINTAMSSWEYTAMPLVCCSFSG